MNACSTLTGIQQLWKGFNSGGPTEAILLAVVRVNAAIEKTNQVLRQMCCVVGNLLQTARSKNQVQGLLIGCVGLVDAASAQHIIAISIHRSSTGSGVAGQHRIKARQRAQRLAAEMRDRNGQGLKAREIFMVMMRADFCDLLSQTGSKFTEA